MGPQTSSQNRSGVAPINEEACKWTSVSDASEDCVIPASMENLVSSSASFGFEYSTLVLYSGEDYWLLEESN